MVQYSRTVVNIENMKCILLTPIYFVNKSLIVNEFDWKIANQLSGCIGIASNCQDLLLLACPQNETHV